jgi:DNA-binding winged helix-turn-helix (wHTH) protein
MTKASIPFASPPQGAHIIYRFEGFSVDTARWELRDRYGVSVPLAPLPFRLLLLLIEQRARVVPKEELFTALWSDAVVSESSLTQAISMVRRALGGGEVGARCIQSVRGRGYRFTAAVEELGPRAESGAPSSSGVRESATRLIPTREPSGRVRELHRIALTGESALLGPGAMSVDQCVVELFEATLERFALHDSTTRARLLAWLAWSLHGADQQARKAELLGEALAMARRLDDAATLSECLLVAQSAPQALAARPLRLLCLLEAIVRAAVTELRELAHDGHA